jgi:hypothetical protein
LHRCKTSRRTGPDNNNIPLHAIPHFKNILKNLKTFPVSKPNATFYVFKLKIATYLKFFFPKQFCTRKLGLRQAFGGRLSPSMASATLGHP